MGDNSYGIWTTATSRAGPGTEYLALLTAPGTGTVSAVVSLFWSIDGNLAFLSSYFQADPTDYPTVPTGYFGVTETGGLQNISDLFPDGGGAAIPLPQGLTIYVQTDAEPAPESALLLASGLMAVGLVRRCARSA